MLAMRFPCANSSSLAAPNLCGISRMAAKNFSNLIRRYYNADHPYPATRMHDPVDLSVAKTSLTHELRTHFGNATRLWEESREVGGGSGSESLCDRKTALSRKQRLRSLSPSRSATIVTYMGYAQLSWSSRLRLPGPPTTITSRRSSPLRPQMILVSSQKSSHARRQGQIFCEELKANFDAKFYGSRTARLKNRRQAVGGIAGTHHQVLHRGRLAKQSASQVAHGIRETGVVHQVEDIDARLQRTCHRQSTFDA